jgi:UDP-N-acetylmuramyl tripeptide synthase
LPFDNSRRLTGSNLFFDSAGAVLETVGVEVDESLLSGWRSRVLRARSALGWPMSETHTISSSRLARSRAAQRASATAIRQHAAGTSLAIAASCDQLFTATEVNEWALCAALVEADQVRWSWLESALTEVARQAAQESQESASPAQRIPISVAFAVALPVIDEAAAIARFVTLSKIEAAPGLRALVAMANSGALLHVLDDDYLTLGSGISGQTWPVGALPDVDRVSWTELHDVPTAIVTGSNGKTTTVRLLAACVRAHGWRDGYNCTDGLFIAGEQIESGDYSGPVGTRTILRDKRVEAAVLETARGGILRRGLAAERALVAVVTNVSADHFGEYGIDDLAGLADVKLVVASTIGNTGLLVLNADDPILRSRADQLECTIGWFSRDYENATLQAHRANGGVTSGVRDGRLIVTWNRGTGASAGSPVQEFDLGSVADMPLTVDGSADYNISNVAGAALAALELGISPTTITAVLARFGSDPADNPGRLMRYGYHDAQVLIDYAHNPDGLRGLMTVAARLHRTGRIALVLGQAGNRANADIEHLAATAAEFRPDFIAIKEIEGMLRGRAPGEVPAILHAALLREGLPESALEVYGSELEAVKRALEWARPGDVIVLPVHDRKVRGEAMRLIS